MLNLHDTCRPGPRGRSTAYQLPQPRLDSLASGFGTDARNIIASCEKDERALGRISIPSEALSVLLISRISKPESGDRIGIVRGTDSCPIEDAQMLSAAITLVKPELDATLWLSHLLVHMIADHGFFGYASGSPRSRVGPLDIALILGLVDKDTHAAITTEIYGELNWKGVFLPIHETTYPLLINCPGPERE